MSAGSRRIVREIAWELARDLDTGGETYFAYTPLGRYAHWEDRGKGWWTHSRADGRIEAGTTLAEAREAAQDHLDCIVLAMVEPWVVEAAGPSSPEAARG